MQSISAVTENLSDSSQSLPTVSDVQITRRNLLTEIDRLRNSYFRIRRELERHNRETKPAYAQWYQENFGVLEASVQALKSEFTEKSRLVDRMNALYTWRGFTRKKAYQRATVDFQVMSERRYREQQAHAEHVRAEAVRQARARRIQEEAQRERDEKSETGFSFEVGSGTNESEIKTYYRKLARALHPDFLRRECPVLASLWLEAQDAYQRRDLMKLKLIRSDCLLEAHPEGEGLGPVDMRAVYTRLRAKFHEVQREKIKISQTDPAWRFQKRDLVEFARKTTEELIQQKADLEEAIGVLNREIHAFTRD